MQGTMPGARRHQDNIKTWTGLSVEESIRMTEGRDKWRKCVHSVDRGRLKNRTEPGGPHPSARGMRIVSAQRTLALYETCDYRWVGGRPGDIFVSICVIRSTRSLSLSLSPSIPHLHSSLFTPHAAVTIESNLPAAVTTHTARYSQVA